MLTKERFAQGLTFQQYLDQMSMNRERFVRALDATVIKPQDVGVLTRHGAVRNILVITEDWCGTSLAYVPYIARLVDGRPGVELRFFLTEPQKGSAVGYDLTTLRLLLEVWS